MLLVRDLSPSLAVPLILATLAGCGGPQPRPLPMQAGLAPSIAALDRARGTAPPLAPDQRFTPAELGLLAVRNSPDLKAVRAQRGVAQAQILEAGLLPDPVISGSYGVLIGGPGIADAIGATLTANISALLTLSAKRRAAEATAMQVDATIVWQEWQTISRAQTLAIDLVQQGRLLDRLRSTLALLRGRGDRESRAVAEGNATLQTLAPFVAEVTALETEYDTAYLGQEQRWQELAALLGLDPAVRPALSTRLLVPEIPPADVPGLVATLPQRRPDLIALQYGYQAQEDGIRGAILGQFPAISLGPNYGNDTSRVATLGPSLSIGLPLFNRNRGQVAIARATRDQLHAEYVARLATAAGGAQALAANLAVLEAQLREARRGLAQAGSLSASASRALAAGLLDQLGYVQLVSSHLGKERQVIALEQQVLDQRTALATLLGIGLPMVRSTATGVAPR